MAAVHALAQHVVGRDLDDIVADMRGFYRELTADKQLRWLGPEKGILHMATGAVLNAVWDLWAKREKKPLWKLLVDLTPGAARLDASTSRYITDALTPERGGRDAAREARRARRRARPRCARDGFPPTRRRPAGSATPTRRCAASAEEAVAAGLDRTSR